MDLHLRLPLGQVLEGDVALPGAVVVEGGVALGEGAPKGVLPREAHPVPFHGQGGKGQGLGGGPVHGPLLLGHLPAGLEETLELGVHLEALGDRAKPHQEVLQPLLGEGGVRLGNQVVGPAHVALPDPAQGAVDHRGGLGLHPGELAFQPLQVGLLPGLKLLLGDQALGLKPLGVDPPGLGLLGDEGVHARLGEGGLVRLVVPPAAVAHEVNDHVLAVAAPVLQGEGEDEEELVQRLGVHVEDGRPHHLGDVRGVAAGGVLRGEGGEAQLVVGHHVEGAPTR